MEQNLNNDNDNISFNQKIEYIYNLLKNNSDNKFTFTAQDAIDPSTLLDTKKSINNTNNSTNIEENNFHILSEKNNYFEKLNEKKNYFEKLKEKEEYEIVEELYKSKIDTKNFPKNDFWKKISKKIQNKVKNNNQKLNLQKKREGLPNNEVNEFSDILNEIEKMKEFKNKKIEKNKNKIEKTISKLNYFLKKIFYGENPRDRYDVFYRISQVFKNNEIKNCILNNLLISQYNSKINFINLYIYNFYYFINIEKKLNLDINFEKSDMFYFQKLDFFKYQKNEKKEDLEKIYKKLIKIFQNYPNKILELKNVNNDYFIYFKKEMKEINISEDDYKNLFFNIILCLLVIRRTNFLKFYFGILTFFLKLTKEKSNTFKKKIQKIMDKNSINSEVKSITEDAVIEISDDENNSENSDSENSENIKKEKNENGINNFIKNLNKFNIIDFSNRE